MIIDLETESAVVDTEAAEPVFGNVVTKDDIAYFQEVGVVNRGG